jgi:AbrB family looped-hinge helix DNA binding protein
MKSITTVTTKGQVTIPIELRRELGIEPGDRIQFESGEGGLQLRRIPSIESVFGSVKPVRPGLTVEQAIREARAERGEVIARKLVRSGVKVPHRRR